MKLNFLSLLNAALATDLVVISLALMGYINGKALSLWYKKFTLGAVIADVLILVIGFIIAYYIYKYFFKNYNIYIFILIVILVQLVHDSLFGLLVTNYKGNSEILNIFKMYIKEINYKILFVDASMLVSTVLLEKVFSSTTQTNNILILIGLVYLTPYLVYSI
jgi:hypothetical protein